MFKAECCSHCGTHPSVWSPRRGGDLNAVVAEWTYCRVCDLIAQARKAGPPEQGEGWNLVLRPREGPAPVHHHP